MLSLKCKLIYCVITFWYFKYSNAASKSSISDKNEILPSNKTLFNYFKIVEDAVRVYAENKDEIDISLTTGLFLSNVHFNRVLLDKAESIPNDIKTKLKNMIHNNLQLLKYFKPISNDINFTSKEFIQIGKLFRNSTRWVHQLNKLVYYEQTDQPYEELEGTYRSWKDYLKAIDSLNLWIPDPHQSDMCLVSLAVNPENRHDKLSWCSLASSCYKMLENGADFGYALQHRLLLLQLARLGRGCSIFSPREDRALSNKFCSSAYSEAQYIAMNNYESNDLMLEIVCLCALNGRAEFLQREWLQRLSKYQASKGCFTNEIIFRSQLMTSLGAKRFMSYLRTWHPKCNSHSTGLAVGAYSAAIRYIIQEYY